MEYPFNWRREIKIVRCKFEKNVFGKDGLVYDLMLRIDITAQHEGRRGIFFHEWKGQVVSNGK